jgi:hypothetical protein
LRRLGTRLLTPSGTEAEEARLEAARPVRYRGWGGQAQDCPPHQVQRPRRLSSGLPILSDTEIEDSKFRAAYPIRYRG